MKRSALRWKAVRQLKSDSVYPPPPEPRLATALQFADATNLNRKFGVA